MHMFSGASVFNPNWKVGSVKKTHSVPIGIWDVCSPGPLVDKDGYTACNKPLDDWYVPSVINMYATVTRTLPNGPSARISMEPLVTGMSLLCHRLQREHRGFYVLPGLEQLGSLCCVRQERCGATACNESIYTATMSEMFAGAIGGWDVARVTNMSSIRTSHRGSGRYVRRISHDSNYGEGCPVCEPGLRTTVPGVCTSTGTPVSSTR